MRKKTRKSIEQKKRETVQGTLVSVGYLILAGAALLCLRYPGIKTLIVRKTYKELQNNHIEQLRGMLHGIARYN